MVVTGPIMKVRVSLLSLTLFKPPFFFFTGFTDFGGCKRLGKLRIATNLQPTAHLQTQPSSGF